VLGALVAARLASGLLGPSVLGSPLRSIRADAVRHWLGTVAIPQVPKAAIARLIELTVSGERGPVAIALAKVTEVTAPYIDRASRSELEMIVAALRVQS
jgi:hypothetical protein